MPDRAKRVVLRHGPLAVMFALLCVGAITDDEAWSVAGIVFGGVVCLLLIVVWGLRRG